MKSIGLSLGILVLLPSLVLAGPNAGGVLLVHSANLTYEGINECGRGTVPDSCGAVVSEIDNATSDSLKVWKVFAAFPPGSSPRLKGLTFGIDYDDSYGDSTGVVIRALGPCADFQLAMNGWPADSTGTSILWNTAQTGLMTEVYWFAGYNYYGNPATFALIPHPEQGGYFVDDSKPGVMDPIADYGSLGFGMAGYVPSCTGGLQPNVANGRQPSLPESGGSTLDSLRVLPATIIRGAPVWTFLTDGFPRAQIASCALVLDGRRFTPSSVDTTTHSSALWTFDLDSLQTPQTADLEFTGTNGGSRQIQIQLDNSPWRVPGHSRTGLTLTLRQGAMVYPVGRRSCGMEDISRSDPSLLALFTQIGVQRIKKCGWNRPETYPDPSPLAYLLRSYDIILADHYSIEAIRRIVATNSAVERAILATPVFARGPLCYQPQDPLWPRQWQLQNVVDTGKWGLSNDYEWCGHEFPETEVTMAIVDFAYRLDPHINIITDGSDPATPDDGMAPHGTACAGLAVAASDGSGGVGAAPGGAVYMYSVGDPPFYESDFASAIHDASAQLGSYRVISTSLAMCGTGDGDLYYAVCYAVRHDHNSIFAVKDAFDDYPGAWDIQSGEDLVLSCSGVNSAGAPNAGHTYADIYAVIQDLWLVWPWDPSGWRQDAGMAPTSSWATPQIAASAAIFQADNHYEPAALYQTLLDNSLAPSGFPILQAGNLYGITGIEDIANFHVTAGNTQMTVQWEVTDPTNIDEFMIYDSASCWGEFQQEASFAPGDPRYTSDGVHYSVPIAALYHRPYYYSMYAMYHGIEAGYHASGTPLQGTQVTAPQAPTQVTFEALSDTEGQLQWAKNDPGATEYWIYREITAGQMDACGGNGDWGTWYHATVQHAGTSCLQPGADGYACLYDTDLVPQWPYSYTVAATVIDAQGRVECMSGFSNQVIGYSEPPPSGVPEAGARGAADFSIGVRPVPAWRPEEASLSLTSSHPRVVRLSVFDPAGRRVGPPPAWTPMRAGVNEVSLQDVAGRVGRGVYFVRAESTDGQVRVGKFVLLGRR